MSSKLHVDFLNKYFFLGKEFEELGCTPKKIQCVITSKDDENEFIWLKPVNKTFIENELNRKIRQYCSDKVETLRNSNVGDMGLYKNSENIFKRCCVVGKNDNGMYLIELIDSGIVLQLTEQENIYKIKEDLCSGKFSFPLCFRAQCLQDIQSKDFKMIGISDVNVGSFVTAIIVNVTGSLIHVALSSKECLLTLINFRDIGTLAFGHESGIWRRFLNTSKLRTDYLKPFDNELFHTIFSNQTYGYVVGVLDEMTIYFRSSMLTIAYHFFMEQLTESYSQVAFRKTLFVFRINEKDLKNVFVFFDSVTFQFYRVSILRIHGREFDCYCIDQPTLVFTNISNVSNTVWKLADLFKLPRFCSKIKIGNFKRPGCITDLETSKRRTLVLREMFVNNNIVEVIKKDDEEYPIIRQNKCDIVKIFREKLIVTYKDDINPELPKTYNSCNSLRKDGCFMASLNASFKGRGKVLGKSLKEQCASLKYQNNCNIENVHNGEFSFGLFKPPSNYNDISSGTLSWDDFASYNLCKKGLSKDINNENINKPSNASTFCNSPREELSKTLIKNCIECKSVPSTVILIKSENEDKKFTLYVDDNDMFLIKTPIDIDQFDDSKDFLNITLYEMNLYAIVNVESVQKIYIFDSEAIAEYNKNYRIIENVNNLTEVNYNEIVINKCYLIDTHERRYQALITNKTIGNNASITFIEVYTRKKFSFSVNEPLKIYECPQNIMELPGVSFDIVSLFGENIKDDTIQEYLCKEEGLMDMNESLFSKRRTYNAFELKKLRKLFILLTFGFVILMIILYLITSLMNYQFQERDMQIVVNRPYIVDKDFELLSNFLKENVTIFCLLHTSPKYKYSRAIPQKNTWLKRCTKYIYVSIEEDLELPSIKGNDIDGHEYSNVRVRYGLKYIYDNYGDKFDWIYKGDDDNYVIMENLRLFLLNKNPNNPHYFGFPINLKQKNYKTPYHSGAGFVLSKNSLKKLVTEAFPNHSICDSRPTSPDDLVFGECLKNVGVEISESRDSKKKHMFIASNVEEAGTLNYIPRMKWFSEHSEDNLENGYFSLSTFPISFHYVSGDNMYAYEYMLYIANVAGKMNPMFKGDDIYDKEKMYKKILDYSSKL
uniref:N-acetylgalactosaminide beta-1,3-galactosyltransferase n=1 Tax=Parastrongyloides trichosuri TaxID=131310 RepID=A0A0N4Z0K6_PARTI